MKHVLLLCLLLHCFSFAEFCRLEEGSRIDFLNDSLWYMASRSFFLHGCMLYTLEDGYECDKSSSARNDMSERSFLDSNVYLYRVLPNQLYIFTSSKATHTMAEVFRDEFLHWQQCGMLSLTYEEADSLIAPLVEEMKQEGDEYCYNECDSVYDTSKFDYEKGLWYPFTYPKTVLGWIEESCEEKSSLGEPFRESGKVSFDGRVAMIPESLRGAKYAVFDMNGRVLEKGLAPERIGMPAFWAILRIDGLPPIVSR